MRQKVVSYLTDVLEVPAEMLVVEQHLSHYGLNTRKRADSVVHSINEENDLFPIAVVGVLRYHRSKLCDVSK